MERYIALLGLGNLHDLAGHPVCGPSFEGFCIDNLMAAVNPQCADLNIEQRFVVYPGNDRFPTRYGTQAIGLVELMQLLRKG